MKGFLLILATFLAGCACTAADCTTGVIFHVDFDVERDVPYDVEVCFGGDCARARMVIDGPSEEAGDVVGSLTLWEAGRVDLDLRDGDFSGTHDVSLTIRDASGEARVSWSGPVEMDRVQPNGPSCGPTCWYAEVET
jgi:hypothetical protein